MMRINLDRYYYSFEDFVKENELNEEFLNKVGVEHNYCFVDKVQYILDYIYGENVFVIYNHEVHDCIEILYTGYTDPSERLKELRKVFITRMIRKLETMGGKYVLGEYDASDVFTDNTEFYTMNYRLRVIEVVGENEIEFRYLNEDEHFGNEDYTDETTDYEMLGSYMSVDRLDNIWRMLRVR